ncbi:MAG TPA: OmpA family protein [Capsulimonadaceae bacterium]|jgi:outer membrane protein OmpA-like peptidoglycan-associated protein
MKLTPVGKIVLLILVIGVAVGAWRYWNVLAPNAKPIESTVPTKINLPDNSSVSQGTGAAYSAPGAKPGLPNNQEVRLLGYAWNAQMGMLLANGGPQSTTGSLMCKHGVNFIFQRQDDNSKLQEALVTFATELSRGDANPSKGVQFVTIMGDGSAAFLAGLNPQLARIGPEYKAKIIDAIGYSHGEDKFMGPPSWKATPSASKGGVCAGVLRDGDWNIAQKWLGDNGLRTNPDEKTYDPDALNWVNASDYIDAAQKYVAGYSETRPVVRNGKRTGETRKITVNAVVTWTPGDTTVAKEKGGLVSIASTKEYSSQMPCVVIGIDKWLKNNSQLTEAMIAAIAEGGDQVKSNPAALRHAAEISDVVYHEANTGPAFWEKYYKGTTETDKTGVQVELGGSSSNNLSDSLLAFGLVPGSANLVAATYTVFGDLVVSQYPSLVPSHPAASDVIDTTYLQAVAKAVAPSATVIAAAKPQYAPTTSSPVISRRSWAIHFEPGSNQFSSDAKKLLDQLSRELLVASGTVIEIHGHTDNQGDPRKSKPLSEARAFAVKNWLKARHPVNFPDKRIRVFAHGEDNPIAPNSTNEGRAANRRVEIILRAAN